MSVAMYMPNDVLCHLTLYERDIYGDKASSATHIINIKSKDFIINNFHHTSQHHN